MQSRETGGNCVRSRETGGDCAQSRETGGGMGQGSAVRGAWSTAAKARGAECPTAVAHGFGEEEGKKKIKKIKMMEWGMALFINFIGIYKSICATSTLRPLVLEIVLSRLKSTISAR
jgi:hypothetical protein